MYSEFSSLLSFSLYFSFAVALFVYSKASSDKEFLKRLTLANTSDDIAFKYYATRKCLASTLRSVGYYFFFLSKYSSKKMARQRVLIFVDIGGGVNFTIKKDNNFSKILKKLRLVNEYQVGNKQFDDNLFIESDSDEIFAKIKESALLQENFLKIYDLFAVDFEGRAILDKIAFANNGVYLDLQTILTFTDKKSYLDFMTTKISEEKSELIEEIADKTVVYLKEIAQEFSGKFIEEKDYSSWQKNISGIFQSLTIVAVFVLFNFEDSHRTIVNEKEVIFDSVLFAAIITLFLLIITRLWLGKTSKILAIMANIAVSGFISITVILWPLLGYYNENLGFSKPKYFDMVIEKKDVRHKKHSTEYSICGKSALIDNGRKSFCIETDEEWYGFIRVGDNVKIIYKEGYFGYGFIDAYYPYEGKAYFISIYDNYTN